MPCNYKLMIINEKGVNRSFFIRDFSSLIAFERGETDKKLTSFTRNRSDKRKGIKFEIETETLGAQCAVGIKSLFINHKENIYFRLSFL